MMKIKKYKSLFESSEDDQLFGRPHYSSEEEDGAPISSEEMDHLAELIESLFKNSGVNAEVDYKNLDLMIYVVLEKKEKMKSILKIFDVVKKLKKDILPQYESEFELWETKSQSPMFVFSFYYSESGDNDSSSRHPF